MKIFLLLFLIVSPIREVENLKLTFPLPSQDIFVDYSNSNFSQNLVYHDNMITAETNSSNFLSLDLNFRVIPDKNYIAGLHPQVQKIVLSLFDDITMLKSYLTRLSYYLEENIRYTEKDVPQDATAVLLYNRANCVGYANVMKAFLDAGGIENAPVKGFFLKKGKKNILIPVPHRWVEISLANGVKFFYDPQRQLFSANYLATRSDVDFKRIKKFKVLVINQSKKIIN